MATPRDENNKIQRGMPNNKKQPKRDPNVEGEGSYTATADYTKSIDGFMKTKGGEIEKMARKAASDLDNDKSGSLKKAEQIGKSHAKK